MMSFRRRWKSMQMQNASTWDSPSVHLHFLCIFFDNSGIFFAFSRMSKTAKLMTPITLQHHFPPQKPTFFVSCFDDVLGFAFESLLEHILGDGNTDLEPK